MDFMDWGPGHVVQFVCPASVVWVPGMTIYLVSLLAYSDPGTELGSSLRLLLAKTRDQGYRHPHPPPLPFPAYTDRCCAKLQSVICQPEGGEGFRHIDEIKC